MESEVDDLQVKVALVTGASRGVGARVALKLAERHVDVIINFRSKRPRAEAIASQIWAQGQRALLAQADLTSEAARRTMIDNVEREFGRLDLLILNASGGLEKDRPVDYAWQLNLTAQAGMVESALPILSQGSRIVFVTSHPAHFYAASAAPEGQNAEQPEQKNAEHAPAAYAPPNEALCEQLLSSSYEPVAASKHAGEQALRARLPHLLQRGITLVVVSGDLIENTITAKLLERAQPGVTEQRRQKLGSLLTVEKFADAIVNAALDPTLPSGTSVCV